MVSNKPYQPELIHRYHDWRGKTYILVTKAVSWKQARKISGDLRECLGISFRITRGDKGDDPYYIWARM